MDLGPPTQNENNLAGATRKPEPCFVLTEWPWRVAASCAAPPSPSCDVVWLACSRYGCTDADIRDTDRPASDGVLQLERVLDIRGTPCNNRRQRALAARSPFHASHTRTHKNHKHITNGSEHYVQNEYVTHIPTSLCRNVPDGRAQTDRSSTFPCAQTDRSNTCKTNVVRVLTWRSLFECSTRHPDESVHALIYKAEPDLKSNRTSTTNIKIATQNPHHFDYHFPPL